MSKMVIRNVGVLSMGKINGVICAALGLLVGVLYGLTVMAFGAMVSRGEAADAGMVGAGAMGAGLVMMIVIPVFYAVFGFVFGLLTAAVYNFASRFVGGIEFEVENAGMSYAEPPMPQYRQPDNYDSQR